MAGEVTRRRPVTAGASGAHRAVVAAGATTGGATGEAGVAAAAAALSADEASADNPCNAFRSSFF